MENYNYYYDCCLKCRLFVRSGKYSNFGYECQGICTLNDSDKYPSAYCSKQEGFEPIVKKEVKNETLFP